MCVGGEARRSSVYRGVLLGWRRRRRRCYKEEDEDIVIDGGVRGRRRERRKGKGDGEGRRREEVEERRGTRRTWKSGRRRDRTVRRDREFSRRCQSSLSLSALEEDAGEPPMDHLPFLIRSSSSVCPSILSVRTRLARGVFRVAPMFPSITLIMSN